MVDTSAFGTRKKKNVNTSAFNVKAGLTKEQIRSIHDSGGQTIGPATQPMPAQTLSLIKRMANSILPKSLEYKPKTGVAETIDLQQRAYEETRPDLFSVPIRVPFAVDKTFNIPAGDKPAALVTSVASRLPEMLVSLPVNAVNFFRSNLNTVIEGAKNPTRDIMYTDPVKTEQFKSILGFDPARFGLSDEAMTDSISKMFRQVDQEERNNPGGSFNIEKAISKTLLIDVLDVMFAYDISKGLVKAGIPVAKIAVRQLPENLLFKIQTSQIGVDEILGSLRGGEGATPRGNAFVSKLSSQERKDLFKMAREYEKAGQEYLQQITKTPNTLGKFAGKKPVNTSAFAEGRASRQLPGMRPVPGTQPAFNMGLSIQEMEEVGRGVGKVSTQVAIEGLTNKIANFERILAMDPFDDLIVKELEKTKKELADLTEQVVKTQSKTPVPIFKDTDTGMHNVNLDLEHGKGEVVYMSPRELYELVARDSVGIDGQKLTPEGLRGFREKNITRNRGEFFENKVKSGEKLDIPVIGYGSRGSVKSAPGEMTMQEGLHRALWAEQQGVEKIPVAIMENPELVKQFKTKSQLTDPYSSTKTPSSGGGVNRIFNEVVSGKKKPLAEIFSPPKSSVPVPSEQTKPAPVKVTALKRGPLETIPREVVEERIRAKEDSGNVELNVSSPKNITDITKSQEAELLPEPSFQNTQTIQADWQGEFTLPAETKVQGFRRAVEDFNIRLKVLNDKIEEAAGQDIKEHLDLWAQKDMLPRQQSDLLRRTRDQKIDLVKRMVKEKVSVDELDDYLHARHAIERNEMMNKQRIEKDLDPVDGLSGMTNADAQEILARDNSKFLKFESEIRAIIKETLKFQVDEGLLSQKDADTIADAYKNYVPLFRDIADDMTGIGMGTDIRGKEIKRAKGSLKRVVSPLGNVFFRKEQAQIRALKNKIGSTIIEMTQEYPFTKDLFDIEAQEHTPRLNAEGEFQFFEPRLKLGENVVGTKIKGRQYFITVKDQRVADALKNLNIARMPKALQFLRSTIGLWSSFKTRWRPEFLLTNFERDLSEALINLGVEKSELGAQGKALRLKVVKDLLPSQRQVWKYLRGGKDAVADEFFKLGGDAGHFWLENPQQAEVSLLKLEKQLKNEGIQKGLNVGRAGLQLVDDINSMVELGVRFSAYKNLVKAGMSKPAAVQAVADMTINFSRSGELSPVLKSFYGFINPTIQGTSKVFRTIGSKQGRSRIMQALAAMIALGFITRMTSMMIDEEGDEQISDWDKNHRMSFAIGDGKTVKLWNMPYGYTTFYSMGSNAAELLYGKKTIEESLGQVLSTALNSFSPFSSQLNDFIPTLVKPIFDINSNEGWYDGAIHPEQVFTNTPKPNAETYFKNTTESAKFIASFLNNITGGGEGKSGMIDISPDDLDYLYDQWIGGPFEFVTSSLESAGQGIAGEFDPNQTPFVRQVFTENRVDSWSYGVIYDTLEKASKKDLSKMEEDRFYRAIETGLEEKIFEQDKADDFIKDFIRARYGIVGTITDDEGIAQLKKLPKADQDRLISTYSERTQTTIRNKLGSSRGTRTRPPI